MKTTLTVTPRVAQGSKAVAKLRKSGVVPAVVYGGAEKASTMVSVDAREFEKVWAKAGESTVVSLTGIGAEKSVLIHDVALDPLYGNAIHVDFYAVRTDQEVEVDVPLMFVGVAPAEKELGGTLVKVMHEIPISALPKDLPHEIEVSIETLKTFDDQILIQDIKLPTGVRTVASAEEVVAIVQAAREEEPEAAAAPADLSAIEVEKKGKEEVVE